MERCWRVDTETAALIFGRRGTHGNRRFRVGALNAKMAKQYWKDLGGEGRKPAIALQALSAAPEQAVEMLKQNLKPAAATGLAGLLERVTALQLDDAENSSDLLQSDPRSIRILRQSLEKSSSEENHSTYQGPSRSCGLSHVARAAPSGSRCDSGRAT